LSSRTKAKDDNTAEQIHNIDVPTSRSRGGGVLGYMSAMRLCVDEDASGDDEDIVTRQGLKKQSQLIIEAKTRRGRPGKRKKKGAAK